MHVTGWRLARRSDHTPSRSVGKSGFRRRSGSVLRLRRSRSGVRFRGRGNGTARCRGTHRRACLTGGPADLTSTATRGRAGGTSSFTRCRSTGNFTWRRSTRDRGAGGLTGGRGAGGGHRGHGTALRPGSTRCTTAGTAAVRLRDFANQHDGDRRKGDQTESSSDHRWSSFKCS